jgi:hypothetical protein
MDADEVVPERIERDHVRVVFEFLAGCIRQPGEPPHCHPHRQVRPFDVGRADMLRIGVAGYVLGARSNALRLRPLRSFVYKKKERAPKLYWGVR